MHKLGKWGGEDVGCWCVLRTDAPRPVPVFTLHRVTHSLATAMTAKLAISGGIPQYELAALASQCDCGGRMTLDLGEVVQAAGLH